MQLKLHKLATTTPAVRAALQRSRLPTKELAAKYGITVATVRNWRNRQQVHDRPAHPPQSQQLLERAR